MNNDHQKTDHAIEPIPEAVAEATTARLQETRAGRPEGPETKRRWNYNGSQPLDYPCHEAVAQFLAAPKQFRRFKSCAAIAKHFNVSRMTIYRWAHDPDIVKRIKWLADQNIVFGDFVACREWPNIVKAQVAAALAGDLRSALFCQNRVCPENSKFSALSLGNAIEGADNVAALLEGDEISHLEELDTANENPTMVEDKDSHG